MTTILDTLRGINAYPIPLRTLVEIAEQRGVPLANDATQDILSDRSYQLAKADLYLWLSIAPNITQGGQSYSFTDEQRRILRQQANALYDDLGEEATLTKPIYGYKGSRL